MITGCLSVLIHSEEQDKIQVEKNDLTVGFQYS
jgi:hypothetical protein